MVTIYCYEGDSQPVSVPGEALLQMDGKTYVFVFFPSAIVGPIACVVSVDSLLIACAMIWEVV